MIRLEGVVAGYGGGNVLQGVDLEVGAGELGCIVGPNGAGKSTVLRAVSGILKPSAGRIMLDGRDIAGLTPDEVLGCGVTQVPQSNGLFPTLTVKENILMGRLIPAGTGFAAYQRLGMLIADRATSGTESDEEAS